MIVGDAMVNSCPHTITAASYLLGVLAASERDEFRRHAAGCAPCRRELAELRPVTYALASVRARARA
ncbi:zf-HC2 domain-containing protein [Amycolatopsis pithecellobii]|uniref:Putative zinc-finger domain-containing protein n=1 Tax=Amycolatopsis pithecellobii TaxID=664692 RepID=A0A6N7YVZ4_9PSEU|nr:zf-HC2 domain-containing protein [Amycolatopsis pithecellobii]MTD57247.1 hypothetical protein [Amycolatopsis pithecellobii]